MSAKELWYDVRGLSESEEQHNLPVVFNNDYTGIMMDDFKDVSTWSKRIKILFMVNDKNIDSAKKWSKNSGKIEKSLCSLQTKN